MKVFLVVSFLLFALPLLVQSKSGDLQLGQQYINFPTSTTNEEAQQHFINGISGIHSFFFEYAEAEFKQAIDLDPSFLMGYWGAAMCQFRSVWSYCDAVTARVYLDQLPSHWNASLDSPEIETELLEALLLKAANVLYPPGATSCDIPNYVNALSDVRDLFPDNIEVNAFYAATMFALIMPEFRGYTTRNTTANRECYDALTTCLDQAPQHPGALHYWIHLNDNPEDALEGLARGLAYPQSTPSSAHAYHMATHLLLRLGFIQQALDMNSASLLISEYLAGSSNEDIGATRDMHSYEWVHYLYLLKGQLVLAATSLNSLEKSIMKAPQPFTVRYGLQLSRQIVETEDYSLCQTVPELANCTDETFCAEAGNLQWLYQSNAALLSVCGIGSIMYGNDDSFADIVSILDDITTNASKLFSEPSVQPFRIVKLQLLALQAKMAGDWDRAIHLATRASTIEETINPPTYGPPLDPIKPSCEFLGELYLEHNQPQKAAEEFLTCQHFFPNRTLTLRGLGRSHAAMAEFEKATKYYQIMALQLREADFGNENYQEALDYLKSQQPSGSPIIKPADSVVIVLPNIVIGIVAVVLTLVLMVVIVGVVVYVFINRRPQARGYTKVSQVSVSMVDM